MKWYKKREIIGKYAQKQVKHWFRRNKVTSMKIRISLGTNYYYQQINTKIKHF